jgi:type I restriction enzyme, S subunit
MAATKKSTLTPTLRFPAFRKAGGWKTTELGQLAQLLEGRVGTTECTPYTVTSGVGLVSQQEKYGRTIAGNSFKNYIVLRRNDFAYNKSATKAFPQGFIARYVGDERAAVPNSIFTCFRVDETRIAPTYLDHLLSSNLHGKWLRTRLTIGARAHGSLNVNDDDLMALPVPLPDGPTSVEEQEKIADCLTTVDGVIVAQRRKLEALNAHKRGLMQRLFPRNGETLPRLRFPQFLDAPEWKVKPLDDFFAHIRNGFVGTATPHYVEGGIPYLQGKNIKDSRIDPSALVTISEAFHEKQHKSRLVSGDILMVQSGHVGECAVVDETYAGANCHALVVMSPRPGQHSPYFMHYLHSPRGLETLRHITTGNTIKHILASDLKALVVAAPERDEQQLIADCLFSLDAHIAAESELIDALKTHKKALMQQLFPWPEEP